MNKGLGLRFRAYTFKGFRGEINHFTYLPLVRAMWCLWIWRVDASMESWRVSICCRQTSSSACFRRSLLSAPVSNFNFLIEWSNLQHFDTFSICWYRNKTTWDSLKIKVLASYPITASLVGKASESSWPEASLTPEGGVSIQMRLVSKPFQYKWHWRTCEHTIIIKVTCIQP